MAADTDLRQADDRHRHARSSRRLLIPAGLVIIWVIAVALCGQFMSRISEVQQNDNSAYLPRSAESIQVRELDRSFTGATVTPAVVVYHRPGGLTPADREKITQDAAAATQHFGGLLAGPPTGPMISQDGRAAELIMPFTTTDAATLQTSVEWIRDRIGNAAGPETHVTGQAAILGDLLHAFAGIDDVLLLVTGGIVLLILILVYRSPLLPLIVLGSAVAALVLATGLVYLLAKHHVITMTGQSRGILDVLVMGAATDYALLMVSRFREELRRHRGGVDAVLSVWRATAPPILASGTTVSAGLLCLLVSGLSSNRSLGPVGAIGIGCSMLVMLTLLPCVLALVGRVGFWPFIPRQDSRPVEEHRFWRWVAGVVDRRRRLILLVVFLALVPLAAGLVRLDANGIPQTQSFTTANDATRGQEVLDGHFPAGTGSTAEVITNAGQLSEVVERAKRVDGVATVRPHTGGNAGNGPPMVVDGRARIDVGLRNSPESQAAATTIRKLRDAVHAVPRAHARVGGYTAVNLDVQQTAKRDRGIIIPIVLVVVLVILVLLLRCLVAPVMLVLTVVVSYFATLGICGYAFTGAFDFPGEDATFPLFAFIFLVALGVDYNIFLMTRVREEVHLRGHRDGVLAGLVVTGGVITSAGLVLAATFTALMVIPLVFLVEVAFAVAAGVLLDTFIVRTLLVPALTLELGRFAWWPNDPWARSVANRTAAGPAAR